MPGHIEIRLWKVNRRTRPSPIPLPCGERAAETRPQHGEVSQAEPAAAQASRETLSHARTTILAAARVLNSIREAISSSLDIDLPGRVRALNRLLNEAQDAATAEEGAFINERVSIMDSELQVLLELHKERKKATTHIQTSNNIKGFHETNWPVSIHCAEIIKYGMSHLFKRQT